MVDSTEALRITGFEVQLASQAAQDDEVVAANMDFIDQIAARGSRKFGGPGFHVPGAR